MQSSEIALLKSQMVSDFSCIYNLCDLVLKSFLQNQPIKIGLIKSALETLYAFMGWIPLIYIFGTELIENVLLPLVDQNQLRNLAIKCLTEITNINLQGNNEEMAKFREKILILISGYQN